ncbi:Pvc16 family protein [Nannocystis pusilla]|uniref:Pvc16 family protein n=1 Tax=Nannocystis pusilla TaxID=889268 RepID=UPI003B7EA68D
MALSLFYVVTAHEYDDDKPVPIVEQRLMGYALKALHDYPIIDDDTKIGAVDILHHELRGNDNALQIIYRPVAPEESATFWNGDDQRLIRFSAFYEVRVVLMKPEPVKHIPGYVLSVGNYILPTGVMHLASSHSVVRFTPPGGDPIVLPASPARVALDLLGPPGPELPNDHLALHGSRLGGGRLVLRSPLFDTPNNQIVVDPALNDDWDIHVTSTRITARVRDGVNEPSGTTPIFPGIYGISVQVSSEIALPGGLSKTVTSRSNELAFAVTPFVTDNDPVEGVGDPVPVEVAAGTDLLNPALAGQIEVYVDGFAYEQDVSGDPKTFQITDNHHVTIHPHFGSGATGNHPFRLIVRGAEAPPYWIEVA